MEGAACVTIGELVCELDGSKAATGAVLACKAGTWAKAFSCAAGQACGTQAGHTSVSCGTTSLAPADTMCPLADSAACSPDLGAVVICSGGKWTAAHHCSPTTCRFAPGADGVGRAQCGADDVYSVGDACAFASGHGVCSSDHTAILGCESGVTKVSTACTAPTPTCAVATVDGGPAIQCQLTLLGSIPAQLPYPDSGRGGEGFSLDLVTPATTVPGKIAALCG